MRSILDCSLAETNMNLLLFPFLYSKVYMELVVVVDLCLTDIEQKGTAKDKSILKM